MPGISLSRVVAKYWSTVFPLLDFVWVSFERLLILKATAPLQTDKEQQGAATGGQQTEEEEQQEEETYVLGCNAA